MPDDVTRIPVAAERPYEVVVGRGVLALGGGAVLSAATRASLADRPVVWLQVTIAHAAGRVGLNEARPLLLGNVRGRLVRLLAERAPLYAEVATVSVGTDGLEPTEVADRVEEALIRD